MTRLEAGRLDFFLRGHMGLPLTPRPPHPSFSLSGSCTQDSPLPSHPLKAVPIAVADEGESESEDDDLKPRGNGPKLGCLWAGPGRRSGQGARTRHGPSVGRRMACWLPLACSHQPSPGGPAFLPRLLMWPREGGPSARPVAGLCGRRVCGRGHSCPV